MTTVCRVCLTGGNVRMKIIANNEQQLYEQLARVTVNTELQPLSICYVCHSQLLRCRRFSDMAHRSETILTDLRNRNVEATYENITALNLGISTNLAVSHIHHTIYINAEANGEAKEELFLHEESFNDKDVINIDSKSKENILSSDIDLNLETEYKSIKIEVTEFDDENVDLLETQRDCNLNDDYFYQEQFKAYTCNKCLKKFQLQSRFDKHMKIHSGVKSYICGQCDKAFSKKNNLSVHIKTHTKRKQYVCKLCKISFAYKCTLTAHRKYHKENPFHCNHCNKRYKDITNLNKHMIIHKQTTERLYGCIECDKKFNNKGHLTEHTRIHSGIRPYACSACPKRFYKKGHLKEHNILHSGVKPHVCAQCGRKFAHKSNLTVHLRLHSNEQLVFDCSCCEKKFTRKASLRRHFRTHEDFGLLYSEKVATKVCWEPWVF